MLSSGHAFSGPHYLNIAFHHPSLFGSLGEPCIMILMPSRSLVWFIEDQIGEKFDNTDITHKLPFCAPQKNLRDNMIVGALHLL